MSNPTKKTPENRARIVALLGGGTTKTAACAAVRMSRETLNEWLKEDEEFALEVEESVQGAITCNVLLIQRAAQPRTVKKTRTEYAIRKDKEGKPVESGRPVIVAKTVEEYEEEGHWQAAAWFLERTASEDFGRRETLKLVPPEKMTDDDLQSELIALATRLGVVGRGEEEGDHLPGSE